MYETHRIEVLQYDTKEVYPETEWALKPGRKRCACDLRRGHFTLTLAIHNGVPANMVNECIWKGFLHGKLRITCAGTGSTYVQQFSAPRSNFQNASVSYEFHIAAERSRVQHVSEIGSGVFSGEREG